MKPVRVKVNDKMQKGYVYWRTKPMGRGFRVGFNPDLTPKQMLELGVFGGKYLNDCQKEFPKSWFRKAKLSTERSKASLNFFGVSASQPRSGEEKDGFIAMIRAAGFSGIVGIFPDVVARTIFARSAAGGRCDGTSRSSRKIVRDGI